MKSTAWSEPTPLTALRGTEFADPISVSERLLEEDRGDVPGWVLITLMTAGLVIVIWAVAGPALSGVFEMAIQRVTSF